MNSKTKIVMGILVIGIVLVGGWWIWNISQIPEVDFYSCIQDSDCIKVKGDCCGCSMGGTATAINKNFEKEWYEKLPKDCYCLTVISDHPTCFKEARCISNKCVLVGNISTTTNITTESNTTELLRMAQEYYEDALIASELCYRGDNIPIDCEMTISYLQKAREFYLKANHTDMIIECVDMEWEVRTFYKRWQETKETEDFLKKLENKSKEEIKQEADEYFDLAIMSYNQKDFENALRYALMARDSYEFLNESELASEADIIIKSIC